MIDHALYESVLPMLGDIPLNYRRTGRVAERTGNEIEGTAPGGLYVTSDEKYVQVSVSGTIAFARLAAAMDRPDLVPVREAALSDGSGDGMAPVVRAVADWIRGLTAEAEVGATYTGTVRRITDFGAFVEVLPNTDGLLHISEMAHTRVERVEDVLKEGDTIDVKVLSVDREGKIRLSRRELLPLPEGEEGERAKERMAQARDAGPPPRRDGPRDRPRGDGPPRGGPPRRDRR